MSSVWIGVGLAAVGAVTSVYGQQQAKKAAKNDANFDAMQRHSAALRSRAVGQRQAEEERRQARLLSSSIQARAGGGGLDPSVIDLMGDVWADGEYRALSALYEGNEGALGLESQANAGLRSARARGRGMDYQTAGTILSTAGGLYTKYKGADY